MVNRVSVIERNVEAIDRYLLRDRVLCVATYGRSAITGTGGKRVYPRGIVN